MMGKVFVFLADGFEEIEGLTVVDMLRRAEIPTVTVSIGNSKMITGAHRIEVDWLYVSEDFYQSAGEELQAAMKEASAYALAYVDADRNKAYEDAYATLQERGLRTARFVTDNLRKSGKELLTSETDFFTQIDKSRYDAVTMIIR